jgi:GT2 family glycosyltransferase
VRDLAGLQIGDPGAQVMSTPVLSVSITTRNRPEALERCVRSLASISDITDTVFVVDDASVPRVDPAALERVATAAGLRLDLTRFDQPRGTTAGKNVIAQRAHARYLFSLDDDAFLMGDDPIRSALAVLQQDPEIAAVAFAQVDERGVPRPPAAQPAPRTAPCYVPAFIGFACLLDRERLLEAGGYREAFGIHGEEREICLRWLDRGFHVVYLPDKGVAHVAASANRDVQAYVRTVMRNDCFNALYNEPLARAAVIVPFKLWSFRRMARGGDSAGMRWVIAEILRALPAIWRVRRPVRWRTVREWNRLKRTFPPYVAAVERR